MQFGKLLLLFSQPPSPISHSLHGTLFTLQEQVPLPGPLSNSVLLGRGLSPHKTAWFGTGPITSISLSRQRGNGELDSLQETDQNMLGPNVQQSEQN